MTTVPVSTSSGAAAPTSAVATRPLPLAVWSVLALGWLVALRSPPASNVVHLVAGGELPVLAPSGAWTPPVSRWLPASPWTVWSDWLAALVAGGVIAAAARRTELRHSAWLALLAALGLALLLQPRELIPAASIVAAGWATSLRRAGLRRSLLLALAGASLAASLEFGVVWLVIGCVAVANSRELRGDAPQTVRRPLLLIAAVVGLLGVLSAWQPGFMAVLLRPVSWIWIRPDPGLLPSCLPVLASGEERIPQVLLLLALAGIAWRMMRSSPIAPSSTAALFLFGLIALGCERYLPLGVLSVMTVTSAGAAESDVYGRWRWARGSLVIIGLSAIALGLAVHRRAITTWVAEGQFPARRVDPSAWGVAGRVQLMNLDQSADWAPTGPNSPLKLLVDDRWELFGTLYPRYAGICRDLREGRNESYLLGDGSWGGYLPALAEWNSTLLVADSGDLDGIRNLSISPDWRILGLDESRTIFGRADDSRCQHQGTRALRVLFQLEWPVRPVVDPQVLVVPDSEAAVRVAGSLCAMRLPYAALRLLPPSGSREAELQRTWCYLELAHRAWRYAGETSLLDQSRALHRLRQQMAAGEWSARDRERIRHGLRGLGLDDIAESFPRDVRERGGEAAASAEGGGPQPSGAEQRIRWSLRRGAGETCRQDLTQLPPAEARYFQTFIDAPNRTAAQLYQDLDGQYGASDFPAPLRSEAAFYLGCLAIEAGDGRSAIGWLQACQRIDPESPWTLLVQFYLGQLSSP